MFAKPLPCNGAHICTRSVILFDPIPRKTDLDQVEFGVMAECGSVTKYRNGCRCSACRKANRDRAYRAKHKSQVAPVVPIGSPTATPPPMGDNEAAWREQCDMLSERADELPTVRAQGVTLARILDDAEQWRYHAQASRQLQLLTLKLTGTQRKSKSKGRLATVSKMSANTRRAAR